MTAGQPPYREEAAWIEREAASLRVRLADAVVAVEDISGFRPSDGTAFRLEAGRRLRSGDPLVARYGHSFRRLGEAEIEREVELAVRDWRYRLGLPSHDQGTAQ
jgi:hypothetical protein